MTIFVGLLRAVNVGGTGKLAMTDLRRICDGVGFARARTYIASGNVVFETAMAEPAVKSTLEAALADHTGRPVGVLVRSAEEMAAVAQANPFAGLPANRTMAIFLNAPPPADTLEHVTGRNAEEIVLGVREIYVHYADGAGNSRLRIAAAASGTARNLNTVAKLVEMARA